MGFVIQTFKSPIRQTTVNSDTHFSASRDRFSTFHFTGDLSDESASKKKTSPNRWERKVPRNIPPSQSRLPFFVNIHPAKFLLLNCWLNTKLCVLLPVLIIKSCKKKKSWPKKEPRNNGQSRERFLCYRSHNRFRCDVGDHFGEGSWWIIVEKDGLEESLQGYDALATQTFTYSGGRLEGSEKRCGTLKSELGNGQPSDESSCFVMQSHSIWNENGLNKHFRAGRAPFAWICLLETICNLEEIQSPRP